MRTCLSCDALQSPEARFCQSCGTLLPEESFAGEHSTQALAQPPSSQALPEIRAYAQSFRQPHAEASLTLGALAALCVVVGIGAVAISGSTEYLYALGVIRHNLPDYSAALRGRRMDQSVSGVGVSVGRLRARGVGVYARRTATGAPVFL
jgi:hypothetical protein